MMATAEFGAPDEGGRRPALYQPLHGSAPDIAGRGVANPLAALLSLGLALRHSLGRADDAAALEAAVEDVLQAGLRTADIAGAKGDAVSTAEMGEAVAAALARRLGTT
jgi:3-isopropylmalate dehydrogenase